MIENNQMFMELLDIPDQKFLDVITLTPTPTLTPISKKRNYGCNRTKIKNKIRGTTKNRIKSNSAKHRIRNKKIIKFK